MAVGVGELVVAAILAFAVAATLNAWSLATAPSAPSKARKQRADGRERIIVLFRAAAQIGFFFSINSGGDSVL